MRKFSLSVTLLLLLVFTFPALAQPTSAQTTQPTGPILLLPELLERATDAAAAGDHQQAVLDYSLFILLNPTFGQGYASRAISYEALGDSAQAIQDLTRAISYGSNSPQYMAAIYFTRASLYLNQNDVRSALADLNASIEAFPDGIQALETRAQVLIFLQEYEEALADYDHLIELQPEDTRYFMDRGFLNAQLGNLEEALADYTRAIELNPQEAAPYAARAMFHSQRRNFGDALDDINSAIDLSPSTGQFYLLRGSLNAVINKRAEAAGDYFQWIRLNETQRFEAPQALTTSGSFTVEIGPGWVYNVPFAATEGQSVTVAASGTSPQQPVDPLLVILGVNGSPVIADDDSGGNMAAFIRNFIIPEDGEYTLVISQAAGGAQQGNIAIQVDLGED